MKGDNMNLKDIAREAGVSAVTVSNVINGNHHKVSQETIERVMKIIEEHDYRPNAMARSLASKKSRIIAVVIPNLSDDDDFASSPYYAHMLSHLEKYIRSRGYYMMTRCVGACGEVVSLFSTWNVDGIVFLGPYDKEEDAILAKLKVPMVFVDSYNTRKDIANVGIDDHKGGYLMGRYLIGLGHREIAFVTPKMEESGVIRSRYEGFVEACKEQNVPFTNENVFIASTFYDEGVRVGKQIPFDKKKFTAVAAMSDLLAFGVMKGLHLTGVRIPEDISVIGFDGLPECDYAYPQLTSISQNIVEKANRAGELLFQMVEDSKDVAANIILDVELKDGDSVAPMKTGV